MLDLADRDIATCWAYLAEQREAQQRAEEDARQQAARAAGAEQQRREAERVAMQVNGRR